jgi:hypothetical protein
VSDVVEPLGAGRIESRELEAEMRSSFLDYAMSTIVARASRRVTFSRYTGDPHAMAEPGLQPGRPRVSAHASSAR